MVEEYRDVHQNVIKQHGNYLVTIQNSPMSERQKKQIVEFVSDLRLGKDGQKVKERRIVSYLMFLIKLQDYFKKDFEKITEDEATQFYKDLQDDKIRRDNKMPYSIATKDMWVRTFKRYMGWLIGDRTDKKYRKIAGWMKEDYKKSNKKAIQYEDADLIIQKEEGLRNKCLFMCLFDSGARIEELLNVRICDCTKGKKDNFWMVHLRGTKTELADRTISIPLTTKLLNDWIKEHPTKEQGDFLFPVEYDNARKIIRMMSKKVLGYSITPHELRHSSATYYIQKFGADNVGGFYYRYGWKFGSKVAEGYIKQYLFAGEVGQQKVVNVVEHDRVEKLENELGKITELLKNFVLFKSGQGNEEKLMESIMEYGKITAKRRNRW